MSVSLEVVGALLCSACQTRPTAASLTEAGSKDEGVAEPHLLPLPSANKING